MFGQVTLFRVSGEEHQMDVGAVLLTMESCVPSQVIQRDFVAPGNLREAGAHQGTPAFSGVVAQPLRVLPADRHHRCPHVACMLRHLPNCLGEIVHLAVTVPQSVIAIRLHTRTMGNVVQIVFHPVHRLHEVLTGLLDKVIRMASGRFLPVVFILQQLLRTGEVPEDTLDIGFLLFGRRQISLLIGQHLYAGTGCDVPDTVGQLGGILSALQVGRHETDAAHSSESICRWRSRASSKLI